MDRGNPIVSFDEDLLDRGHIARHLAHSICNDFVHDSCTIGISGHWGSGKTSIINMVKQAVLEENSKIIIIDFNPVDYQANSENIARLFFEVILKRLKRIRKLDPSLVERYKTDPKTVLESGIMATASAISPVPGLSALTKHLKTMGNAIQNPSKFDSVDTVRKKISDILEKANIKLLIVIDDIDRLLPGEAIQILKLIRITACFNNVFYLFGYDEEVLSKQIDDELGHKYLEKFIQVPIHLPEASQNTLYDLFNRKFTQLLNKYGYKELNCSSKICLQISLESLREMKLLLNRFDFKMAMCPQDVCPEDLLALTFIEMKDLSLYNWIFQHRFDLCRAPSPFMKEEEITDTNNHHYDLLREFKKQENDWRISQTVMFMYPCLDTSYWQLVAVDRSDRICSSSSCNRYFVLNASAIPVSNDVVEHILHSKDRYGALYGAMMDLAPKHNGAVLELLDKLHERLSELSEDDCCLFAKVLLYQVPDPDFCELFSSQQTFPQWDGFLNDLLRKIGEITVKNVIIRNMQYEYPYAAVMLIEYLRHLLQSPETTVPVSRPCLKLWIDEANGWLISRASEFSPNDDSERTGRFLTFLGRADTETAKREFNRIFETDESAYQFFAQSFNTKHIFDFSVEEIALYLPDNRIDNLCSINDGDLKPLLERVMQFRSALKNSI